ncbi:MAG: protein-glutamate O-methyltransferase CheR, partial [Planctomycetes bacterium]|nr:protein-glutamate O-methyltransferase CheR [Planctomycetota bacterium]
MSQPFTSAHRLVADPLYPSLKAYLIGATGLAYYTDKDSELATRVSQRLAELGLRDCGSYLALLKEGPRGETELDRLIE